ncbi:MAG: heme A synthase [Candidatus Eisenbacteria bacterium]|uniref:Heme A synthase n=1 Tax=Eiseniibacteriota bacterium TaxID=2212470 RepID=A0A538UAS3_UNCEI|nr:MAG: heme A synthase [Candidatus Eisenbacteria bacterium]
MFALMVLGSLVRTTGSGLACPDWPLCQGRLIPPFQFNVLVEWLHRLLALLVSLLLAATVASVWTQREVRARLGALAGLAVALLGAQILLGALTVWKLLDPAIVGGHLAVALLLFSTMIVLTLAASREASDMPPTLDARPDGLLPLFGGACALIYLQAVLGGVVSASGASLACPDWPACAAGEWFPPLRGLIGVHMMHRYVAYLLTAYLVVVAARARRAGDGIVAGIGPILLGLVLGQIVLGVINLLLGIQPWLSAFHLANAAGMLALTVATTFRIASMPAARTSWAAAPAS